MKKNAIKCPHCGCEYLPGEIYYPNDFVGQPSDIIRDEKGEILGFNGEDMNTEEEFCCEKCGKSFKIDAVVTFRAEPIVDVFDDDSEYTSVIKKK